MDTTEKLRILADAAKYDAACTSSGSNRASRAGSLGNTGSAGCCHSFTPDGRCISLLKVLFTNACIHDCAYCVNRVGNDTRRVAFTPRELADLTIGFYRRNYIEGLFLSSGVMKSADYTARKMLETVSILRGEYGFRGYIHVKAIPGMSPDIYDSLGALVDRMSLNMELPSADSLGLLAPGKSGYELIGGMRYIRRHIDEDRANRSLVKRAPTYMSRRRSKPLGRSFVPAGQSTQMIIGASPESDHHILNLTSSLYRVMGLKRVFYSAYIPVNVDKRLPNSPAIPLDREHRLYQADWLMRFYGFDVDEIIDEKHPFLDPSVDPKASWALNHLDLFPIEINRACLDDLLRVPGIGPRGARLIVAARRKTTLHEAELRKLGIAYKRARYFITCDGRYAADMREFTPETLRARMAAPIDGGRHGRRATRVPEGQMSLADLDPTFDAVVDGTGSAPLEAPAVVSSSATDALTAAFGAPCPA